MAGLAILLDLLKRTQGSPSSSAALSIHSHGLFTAGAAASAAALYIAASKPFVSRAIFGDGGIFVAYCDAAGEGAIWDGNYIPKIRREIEKVFNTESEYKCKQYPIEIRPLFSAFQFRSLALTSLRSFLLFYLPILEPRPSVEDDEDLMEDTTEERHVDLVVPFKNSIKQIIREVSIVTIRRVLERLTVQCCSQRMAWKLLKDASKSARRKAEREMPTYFFLFSVSRTTFRGHALSLVASWIVQVIIEFYRYCIRKPDNDGEMLNVSQKITLFRKKVYVTTIKCTSSLVFASIGAGIGALFHPSMGQWIGSAVGDYAGPIIAVVSFEKLHLHLLSD